MKTKSVKFPFSVADTTAGPSIHWSYSRLTVEFNDYQGTPCRARFNDVSHFEWLVEEELDSKTFAYDGVVEVIGSPLIDRLSEIGEISRETRSEYRHLVIGFNEVGAYLIVVCRGFDAVGPEA